jgi:hypothetical protein
MKALKIAFLAIALVTGVGAAAQAGQHDGCVSKSLHGLWDCR